MFFFPLIFLFLGFVIGFGMFDLSFVLLSGSLLCVQFFILSLFDLLFSICILLRLLFCLLSGSSLVIRFIIRVGYFVILFVKLCSFDFLVIFCFLFVIRFLGRFVVIQFVIVIYSVLLFFRLLFNFQCDLLFVLLFRFVIRCVSCSFCDSIFCWICYQLVVSFCYLSFSFSS